MRNLRLLLILLYIPFSSANAQTLGEAVHTNFGQSKSEIIGLWGTDYYQDVDKSGYPFIAYQRIFVQNGKDVQGGGVFNFRNDKVYQYTTIVGQEHYQYWDNEFKKKLIRRDGQYWIEPEYNLVWNLKTYDNKLYITAIDTNVLRAISPESFGHNWSKAAEAEFMKNCVYGNPNNVGHEDKYQPMCTCALGKLKYFYGDARSISGLTGDDLIKLLKSCIK